MNATEETFEQPRYNETYLLLIVFGIILCSLCIFKSCGLYCEQRITSSTARQPSASRDSRRGSRMAL